MRFVVFDIQSGEIQGAASSDKSLENSLKTGLAIARVEDISFKGALKNYVFCPNAKQTSDSKYPEGRVQRKPQEEWDMEAEEKKIQERIIQHRFRKLDITELHSLEIYLLTSASFVKLATDTNTYSFFVEGISISLTLSRETPSLVETYFELGGQQILFHTTEFRFKLDGNETFIKNAILSRCGSLKPHVAISHIIQQEAFKFALKVANRYIECYRIAYDDPGERLIGITDLLGGAVVFILHDGNRSAHYSGVGLQHTYPDKKVKQNAESLLQSLLARRSPPFIAVAVSELKKANLYGQYRECLVWAAVIISSIIEQILLEKLPKESQEYKEFKKKSGKIEGRKKRKGYFKKATGYTLAEFLTKITSQNPSPSVSPVWQNLAENVETVINERNLLLHRRKSVGVSEGRLAYETCMNFIYALQYGLPYTDDTFKYL